jgi:hypothetical protein
LGAREQAALRVDDLAAWSGQVDQPVGLALCRTDELGAAKDLE